MFKKKVIVIRAGEDIEKGQKIQKKGNFIYRSKDEMPLWEISGFTSEEKASKILVFPENISIIVARNEKHHYRNLT